jgi:hypothetical protein
MRRALPLVVVPFLLACSLVASWLPQGSGDPSPTAAPAPFALPPTYTPTIPPAPPPTLPPTPAAIIDLDRQAAALRRAFQDDLAGLLNVPRYWLDIDIDLDLAGQAAVIDGWARIQFTNPLADPLEDLVLMLWPNDPQYHASMVAGPVAVMGRTVEPEVELEGVALRILLPRSLDPGERVDLSLPFRVEIDGPMLPSEPARMAITQDVLIAPTFYPLIPHLEEGGWQVMPAAPGGDTTNSDVAVYEMTVTAPSAYGLTATGALIEPAAVLGEQQTATFVTGPVRDVAIALGPLEAHERQVDGVTLRVWVLAEHEADVRRMLNAAEVQLRVLSEAVGPYPYTELDVVDAPNAYGGIEYPGLVFIGTLGTPFLIEPLVHEVGHQWFYGLIGNDQLLEPWLDEAAASYTEVLYYEAAIGPERGTTALAEFRQVVEDFAGDPRRPIGLPLASYPSEQEYAIIVYAKGALFFDALRRELGDRAFLDFLRAYYETHRYGFADADGFLRVAESVCACDLEPLFNLWIRDGGPLPGP